MEAVVRQDVKGAMVMSDSVDQETDTMEESLVPIEERPVTIIDGPVVELFVDGYSSATFTRDTVKINWHQVRSPLDPDDESEQVLVARMNMGISSFVAIFEGFQELLAIIRDQGLIAEGSDDGEVPTGNDES